jgi:hypothetical protein
VGVIGLAHQIQRVTHAHLGLERDPSMELVTGDEVAHQFPVGDRGSKMGKHRRQLTLALGIEPTWRAVSGAPMGSPRFKGGRQSGPRWGALQRIELGLNGSG